MPEGRRTCLRVTRGFDPRIDENGDESVLPRNPGCRSGGTMSRLAAGRDSRGSGSASRLGEPRRCWIRCRHPGRASGTTVSASRRAVETGSPVHRPSETVSEPLRRNAGQERASPAELLDSRSLIPGPEHHGDGRGPARGPRDIRAGVPRPSSRLRRVPETERPAPEQRKPQLLKAGYQDQLARNREIWRAEKLTRREVTRS